MMIKLPFFQKKKEKRFICLDIGTESTKVLICSAKREKEKKIITILSASLGHFENDNKDFQPNIIKKTILETIRRARLNFLQISGKEIQTNKKWPVFISLPANILKGKILFQSFYRQNPKRIIDRKEEGVICKEILRTLQSKTAQLFAEETGILPKDIHFANLKLLEIKIDGYEVPVLQGYEGKEIKFRILVIFLAEKYLKTIENITKDCGFNNIKIVHPVEGILNFLTEKSNGIFLDIGGSLSRLILVNNGKLEKIDEFEIGGEAFSKKLSDVLGLSIEQARLLKENYSKRLLTEEARERTKEIFSQPLEEWFKALKSKLSEYKTLLPFTFYLFGGGSLLPEIQEILEEGDWKGVSIISRPEVKSIFPKDFKDIVDNTKTVNTPKETSSILLCFSIL